jgi:hypothetical protein
MRLISHLGNVASKHCISSGDLGLQQFAALRSLLF